MIVLLLLKRIVLRSALRSPRHRTVVVNIHHEIYPVGTDLSESSNGRSRARHVHTDRV